MSENDLNDDLGERSPHLAEEEPRGLYQAVIEETPLVIYAKDASGRFLLSNRKHASLLGMAKEQVIGKTDGDLFPDDSAAIDDTTQQVLRSGTPLFSEFPLPIDGEERIYHETIFRLHQPSGEVLGVGGIATDITERRRLEFEVRQQKALLEEAKRSVEERARQLAASLEELRATRDAMIAQEKMAALGSLVAGVAHEINTPLGVASMATDLLKEGLAAQATQATTSEPALAELSEAAELLSRNLNRASELVQSFKKVAVDQASSELRATHLQELCEDLHLTLRPLLQKHRVDFRLDVAPELTAVLQPGDLVQILTNLTHNACSHAFDEAQSDRYVHLSIRPQGDALQLVFHDNGRGMDASTREQALEPFFTTARANGNSGLGLAIVHNIIHLRFGGTIELTTAQPQGCRIVIELQAGSKAFKNILDSPAAATGATQ
jgi:PAS domain S-box-containing protein